MSNSPQSNTQIAKNTAFLYFRMILVLFVSIYTTRVVLNAPGVVDNGIKTNFALVQAYLWDGYSTQSKGKYIEPMASLGWSCVSHSLRHNQPIAKKTSVYINYEIKQCRKECEEWGMNSDVFVYNWDGTWEQSDTSF